MSATKNRAGLALAALFPLSMISLPAVADDDDRLQPMHWFDLETVSDPQISPDGLRIVYVRHSRDIMTDRAHSNLWIVNAGGEKHRPLTTGKHSDASPRWSHDGTRIAFTSSREDRSQLYVMFVDDRQLVRVTNTPKSPSNLTWSPDDETIAFTMPVPGKPPAGVELPDKPKGAKWADPPQVIEKLGYRFNGRGYLPAQFRHIFVVPALGGTPRQLTDGDYDHGAPDFSAYGSKLYFSATRKPDHEWIVQDSEIYSVDLRGNIYPITDRRGPDNSPIVSPDGKWIAYTGFDDGNFSSTITRLYVMRTDGSEAKCLTPELDRSVGDLAWDPHGGRVFFTRRDRGSRNIHVVSLAGVVEEVSNGPQQIRGFSVAKPTGDAVQAVGNRRDLDFKKVAPHAAFDYQLPRYAKNYVHIATVRADSKGPNDIALFTLGSPKPIQLTRVNDDVLAHRILGEVEEVWYKSSFDQRDIQGWIVYPPDFDPEKKYPLILYIHGGPHAMYGVNFGFEFQVHAAKGYVVFYCNPRGSTGYGKEFANIIQYNYPGDDFFDLMSGVDEVVRRGFIDEENLFVTGGSGGGVLTCWVIGRTDRFAAAVSQYPVINWYSFLLTCDISAYVHKRWFKGYPWDELEDYMKRSPISLVGNVSTPCLLITGEVDWRTPISETEQYYQALRLQKKEAKMVRIPDEAHGVRGRPSHYIAKILHIQEWFEDHKRGAMRKKKTDEKSEEGRADRASDASP